MAGTARAVPACHRVTVENFGRAPIGRAADPHDPHSQTSKCIFQGKLDARRAQRGQRSSAGPEEARASIRLVQSPLRRDQISVKLRSPSLFASEAVASPRNSDRRS